MFAATVNEVPGGDLASGFVALIIVVGLLVIAVVWIIFPFVVNSALNRIQKLLAKQNELLGQITDRQNEANKALQWIINNWSSRP
jgi:predicted PurR-regulated permease PerM